MSPASAITRSSFALHRSTFRSYLVLGEVKKDPAFLTPLATFFVSSKATDQRK